MQRSLCPKAVPQILKSDKLTFQEKEYLTMARMKEQTRANGKTVQDCIKEKSSQNLPKFLYTGSNVFESSKRNVLQITYTV